MLLVQALGFVFNILHLRCMLHKLLDLDFDFINKSGDIHVKGKGKECHTPTAEV